jgi:hypothetical protein
MKRSGLLIALLAVVVCTGCILTGDPPPVGLLPPPVPPQTETVPLADTDAFDLVLEAALTKQSNKIVIPTKTKELNWSGRLDRWLVAWNASGAAHRTRGSDGTRSLPLLPDDSAGQMRKLTNELLDRTERLARESAAWWKSENERRKRIALLKPYSLDIQADAQGYLLVVFERDVPTPPAVPPGNR